MASRRPLLNGIVNRIAFVGIELEGGWNHTVRGYDIVHDGSVKFLDPYIEQIIDPVSGRKKNINRAEPLPSYQYEKGEIVSPKLTTDAIQGWLETCYPQHVNETCGLHVHMSFHHKLNYSRLMVPEFMHTMIQELRQWGISAGLPNDHMFFNRLDPNHPWTIEHCAHTFLGDQQVLIRKKEYNSRGRNYSRYTFLNYCDGQHNTIECRGLPMFGGVLNNSTVVPADIEMAYQSIMAVLNVTNRFLSKMRQRERSALAEVPEMPPIVREFGAIVR